VDRTKYLVYSLSGLISAMAGLMYTARIRAVVPDMGITSPLEVITAVLIGGTAITGGKGSVLGSLLGILAMYLLLNGFNLLGLNPFWQTIILGAILIYVVGQENILRGLRAAFGRRKVEKQGMSAEKRLEGQARWSRAPGSGIGRAIAVAFAREGPGWASATAATRRGSAAPGAGAGRCSRALVRADVSSAQEVAAMVRELEIRWQGLEVLVNNSGIGTSASPDRVAEIDEADWDRVLDVNLKGVMLACRAVLPGMMRRGSGAIVNISSIRGLLGNPSLASYCASKGGEVLLTRSLALDYARYGVRVNCICPGFVLSEMLAGYIAKQADPAAAQRAFAAMAPQNRIGRPEEIAAAAVFLASRASSFVTGVALPVDGGYTASGARDLL
jgi:dihydroanticapsin dehydrogenase